MTDLALRDANDPEVVYLEIMEEIAYNLAHRPRDLQVHLGPSEVGDPCPRALLAKLFGIPEPGSDLPNWRAWVGSCMHTGLEGILADSFMQHGPDGPRFLLETKVTVGVLGDYLLTGHCDVFDQFTGLVIDYKALAVNEPVATPTGWRTIGLLKIGDQVMGSDFLPHRVVGINDFPGERKIFRVGFNDGTYVRATADHLWTVQRYCGDGRRPITVRTDQLRTTRCQEDQIAAIDPTDSPDTELPIHPYVLGVWLGDGTCVQNLTATQTSISLGHKKRAVSERIRNLTGAADAVEYKAGTLTVRPAINHALVSLGLHSLKSPAKFVPPRYLRASAQQRWELLSGLMDTDGTIIKSGSVQFCTTSPDLAEAVADLARSLGGWASIWTKGAPNYYIKDGTRHHTNSTEQRVVMRMPINPFQCHEQHATRWDLATSSIEKRKSLDKLVKTVEPDGVGAVRCIAIDAPDELFLARSLTPTHNTKSMTQHKAARRHGIAPVYRVQAHCYGLGMANLGHQVRNVMFVYVLRDGELSDSFFHAEPFNPLIALAALERANQLWALGQMLGVQAAMALYPPCTEEFCRFCGNYRAPYDPPRADRPTSIAEAIAYAKTVERKH